MNQVSPSLQVYKTFRKAIMINDQEKEKGTEHDLHIKAKEKCGPPVAKPVKLPNQRSYKIVVNAPPIKQESNVSNKSKREMKQGVKEIVNFDDELGGTRGQEEEGPAPELIFPLETGDSTKKGLKEVQGMEDRLEGMSGAFIKQRSDFLTVINGCDQNNFYDVFDLRVGVPKGKALFRFMETSSCCSRACTPADCRSTSVDGFNIQYGQEDDEPCLHITRESSCACFCFGRPKTMVYCVSQGQSRLLGSFEEPWSLTTNLIRILDEENQEVYKVASNCCQAGFLFGCFPCNSCQTIKFDINSNKSKFPVGSLAKRGKGACVDAEDLDFNHICVNFPENASWQHRALIIACAVLLEMLWFEDRQPNKTSIACGCHAGLQRCKKKKR